MHKERRKQLEKAIEKLSEVQENLTDIQTDEEEYRDNMPENMRESDKYYGAEAAVNALEEARETLSSAIDEISAAMEQ